jgi:hypothetical protein
MGKTKFKGREAIDIGRNSDFSSRYGESHALTGKGKAGGV